MGRSGRPLDGQSGIAKANVVAFTKWPHAGMALSTATTPTNFLVGIDSALFRILRRLRPSPSLFTSVLLWPSTGFFWPLAGSVLGQAGVLGRRGFIVESTGGKSLSRSRCSRDHKQTLLVCHPLTEPLIDCMPLEVWRKCYQQNILHPRNSHRVSHTSRVPSWPNNHSANATQRGRQLEA